MRQRETDCCRRRDRREARRSGNVDQADALGKRLGDDAAFGWFMPSKVDAMEWRLLSDIRSEIPGSFK